MDVFFFKTLAGNEPVLDWLRGLDLQDRRVIGEDLRTVQLRWPLGMPLCRSLGAGLHEVRSDLAGNRIARLVFFQFGSALIVVEGFIKKTRSTPDAVLRLSKARKADYERAANSARK